MNSENKLREVAVKLLEAKGYRVSSLAKGQGVPKFSRIEMEKDGTVETGSIKVSTGGRISFTRNPNGSYKVLSEVDFVIHVTPDSRDHSKVWVTLFDRATVLSAFEENYAALAAHGMEHIPIWVNPEKEQGWRMTGSGFMDRAIWSARVSEDGQSTAPIATVVSGQNSVAPIGSRTADTMSVMERIKTILSEHMGVKPDLIDIEVRVRV